VPKQTVTPPESQLKRIREETALIVAARTRNDPREDFLDGFIWPVTGQISGVYGSQRYYNGKPGRPHYGVDIARPMGTPVVAPAGGLVTLAHDDMFYSGGTLMIDHGHGLSSAFRGWRRWKSHRTSPRLAHESFQASHRPRVAGTANAVISQLIGKLHDC